MPDEKKPSVPPLLALSFAILAVSTASIFIRYAQEQAPSLVIAAFRLSVATLVLAPLALTRRQAELRSLTRAEIGLVLLSGIFLALHFATWITSLEYTTVASSVVLVSTVPLWVALLSPFTIKERVSQAVWLGMLLALAGGMIVGLSDSCAWRENQLVCPPLADFVRGEAFLGDLLALAGAVTAAGYLLIGRRVRRRLSLLSYVFAVYGVAAVVLLGIVFSAGLPLGGYPSETYLWMILLALVPQLIGHSTYNWALGYVSAALVSVALLGEPIGSTILAYILLRESPSVIKLLGGVLILGGIYITARGNTSKR